MFALATSFVGIYTRPTPDPLGDTEYRAELTRNDHGWFCDRIGHQKWFYPPATNPYSGWGHQIAKSTPLEAVLGFLEKAPGWYGKLDGVVEVSVEAVEDEV